MRLIDAEVFYEEIYKIESKMDFYTGAACLAALAQAPTINADDYFNAADRIKPCPNCRYQTMHDIATVEKNRWISTKERLPEADGQAVEVVVFIAGAQKSTTLYFLNGEFFDDNNDYYDVVCWQPLPEPPKQEELLQ